MRSKNVLAYIVCRILLVLFSTCVNFFIFANSFADTWVTEAIANFKLFSPRGITVDSNGHPHIIYGGNRLYHAYFDENSWHYEIIDSLPGGVIYNPGAIAIDASGNLHISFYCFDEFAYIVNGYDNDGFIKYATNASGSWVTTTIDNSISVYYSIRNDEIQNTSIAVDSSSNVHISYHNGSKIKYATNASGSWISTSLDNDGSNNSIAVDSSGNAHISYYGSNNHIADSVLKYATNASGSWVITTIEKSDRYSGSSNINIAIDPSGNVHITYGFAELKYTRNMQGSWTTTNVTNFDGGVSSMSVDQSGNVHISYGGYYGCYYTTNTTGSWSKKELDSSGGYNISIALDKHDNVHISYYNNEHFKYATNTSGSWLTENILSNWGSAYRNSLGIAVDSINNIHLSCTTNSALEYVTYDNLGLWSVTTVDSLDCDYDGSCSIAVDKSGRLHISYYDCANNAIKYATNVSRSWATSTIANDVHGYASFIYVSIAVDSSGKVHISYNDYNINTEEGFLKYITNASGSWVTTTIESSKNVSEPWDNSIAVDSSGKVHISYYNSNSESLKYATNASGLWVTATIDSEGNAGEYNSIAIDKSGKVHIGYCYREYPKVYDLKYATNVSSKWVTDIVDSDNSVCVGELNSIAVDKSGKIHISYRNCWGSHSGSLVYATNSSGAWVKTTVDGVNCLDTSIALDTSGKVHIGYIGNDYDGNNGRLKYANNANQSRSTPTPTPTVTTTVTATPAPTPTPVVFPICEPASISVDTTTLTLKRKKSGTVTVTVTGDDDCAVEGETVTATINEAGKKRISITPPSDSADENGQATFWITAKKKTGAAKVAFKVGSLKKSVTVMVK